MKRIRQGGCLADKKSMEVHLNPGMEAQRKNPILLTFVGVSALLHAALFLFLFLLPAAPLPQKENIVYLDFTPPAPNLAREEAAAKRRQVVQSEQAENSLASKDAKYLGERNQTVEQETKAKRVDIFQNGSTAQQTGGKGGKLSLKDLAPTKAIEPPTQKEIDGYRQEKRNLAQAESGDGRPRGENAPSSATNDYLKEAKESDRTMLNTKEFVYYSYYNRIRKKLEISWNSKLRSTFDSYIYGGRQLASDKNYVTGVIVVLDRNGRVTGVQMLERSGARDLDQAAVDAFNDAGPFPDPPSGLVDERGEIRIRWDFVLQS